MSRKTDPRLSDTRRIKVRWQGFSLDMLVTLAARDRALKGKPRRGLSMAWIRELPRLGDPAAHASWP